MVKVIASSLRKGNVVDVDGKLYVVLTAQNFHPGKGTHVTQVDMRRNAARAKAAARGKARDLLSDPERIHRDLLVERVADAAVALRALDAADGHVAVEGLGPDGDLDWEARACISFLAIALEGPGPVAAVAAVESPRVPLRVL